MLNLIGFLLPAIIDTINNKIKDSDNRFWMSVLICILTGFILVVIESNLFDNMTILAISEAVAMKSMAMFGMAQLTYKKAWEDSDIRVDLGLNAKVQ